MTKGRKPKIKGRKLRSSVNGQGAFKRKGVKQKDIKHGLDVKLTPACFLVFLTHCYHRAVITNFLISLIQPKQLERFFEVDTEGIQREGPEGGQAVFSGVSWSSSALPIRNSSK
jgi:hypothetical protein